MEKDRELDRSREASLKKINAIIEDRMTSQGLNEEQKNAKTAEFVAAVKKTINDKVRTR
jgi:hypothetical protein